MILFKVNQKLWEIFELGNCICKMHKTNGVHKVSCFSCFLWGLFEMLITWCKMGCWQWDDDGREAQCCESLAGARSHLQSAHPGGSSWLGEHPGVSAGVARSCWEPPRPGEGCRVRVPQVRPGCESTALVSLGKSPRPQTLSSPGSGWTSLTFVPLVIIWEPSSALGLFSNNLLVKPLSSRDLILLG